MPLFGPPNVERLATRRNVSGLIKALNYQNDAKVRQEAAIALGKIGEQSVVLALIEALNDRVSMVRAAAVAALGTIADPRAVDPLVALLQDTENAVRGKAVVALRDIRDRRAVGPLIEVLKQDSEPQVQSKAAAALGNIGDPHAVASLISALSHRGADVRVAAAMALGKIGDPSAVEPLLKTLQDSSFTVRDKASKALLLFHDDAITASCSTALEVGDQRMRAAAVEMLGRVGGSAAVELLIPRLNDTDPGVRSKAIETLASLGDTRAVEPLVALLQDTSMRLKAIEALVSLGDARAVEPLVMLLQDDSARGAAIAALGTFDWQPSNDEYGGIYAAATHNWNKCIEIGAMSVEPLIALLDDEEAFCEGAAITLGQIGDPRSFEPLAEKLRDDFARLEQAALSGNVQVAEQYISALNEQYKLIDNAIHPSKIDTKHGQYEFVSKAWGYMPSLNELRGGPGTIEGQFAALRLATTNGDADGVKQAISILRTMDLVMRQAVDVVRKGWAHRTLIGNDDPERRIRGNAAKALGALGDERAVPLLITALDDISLNVQLAAGQALEQIGSAAVEPLIAALPGNKYPKDHVRRNIVTVLGSIKDARAADVLNDALNDKDKGVREAASQALAKLGGDVVFKQMLERIKEDNTEVRKAAAAALGDIGSTQAINPLITALGKASPREEKVVIAQALKKIGAASVSPLISALKRDNNNVRAGAAIALGLIGDEQALDALLECVEDRNAMLVQEAATALGQLRSARATKPLINAFWRELYGNNEAARHAILRALGAIPDFAAVEHLQSVLDMSRYRSTAEEILRELGMSF